MLTAQSKCYRPSVRPRVVPGTCDGHHGPSHSAPKPSPGAAVHTCGIGIPHSHYYHETATPTLRIHPPLPPSSLSVVPFSPPPLRCYWPPLLVYISVLQAHKAARSSTVAPPPFLIYNHHASVPAAHKAASNKKRKIDTQTQLESTFICISLTLSRASLAVVLVSICKMAHRLSYSPPSSALILSFNGSSACICAADSYRRTGRIQGMQSRQHCRGSRDAACSPLLLLLLLGHNCRC